MKTLYVLPAVALVLAGCATQPAPRYANSGNPYEWQTVSVTPVPAGTGARSAGRVEYSSEPVPQTVYVPQPVYATQPVYMPQPVYVPQPAYYWPPVTIGLDFVFSNHHHGWRHGRRR